MTYPNSHDQFVSDLSALLARCNSEIAKFTLVNLSPEECGKQPRSGLAWVRVWLDANKVSDRVRETFRQHGWTYIAPEPDDCHINEDQLHCCWQLVYTASLDRGYQERVLSTIVGTLAESGLIPTLTSTSYAYYH